MKQSLLGLWMALVLISATSCDENPTPETIFEWKNLQSVSHSLVDPDDAVLKLKLRTNLPVKELVEGMSLSITSRSETLDIDVDQDVSVHLTEAGEFEVTIELGDYLSIGGPVYELSAVIPSPDDEEEELTRVTIPFSTSAPNFGNKHFKNLYLNDDGSYTLIEPYFEAPENTRAPIAYGSDPDGVCKLFGLDWARSREGGMTARDVEWSVGIDYDGEFYGYGDRYHSGIGSIICFNADQPEPAPSQNAEAIVRNDDGSTTLWKPRFSYSDGYTRTFASPGSHGSWDGICKLYGFNEYVNHSATTADSKMSVYLTAEGKFTAFVGKSSGIESMMCR